MLQGCTLKTDIGFGEKLLLVTSQSCRVKKVKVSRVGSRANGSNRSVCPIDRFLEVLNRKGEEGSEAMAEK